MGNGAELLTINEAARMKGISRQALHAAIAAGRIPVIEVTIKSKRVKRADLKKLHINPNMRRAGRKPNNGNQG